MLQEQQGQPVVVTGGAQVTQSQHTRAADNVTEKDNSVDQELAEKFAGWFFQMLNSYHPFSQEAPSQAFGPQHFFKDCEMKMISSTPDITRVAYSGDEQVSQRLMAFVKEEGLKFNPNLDPGGVKGIANPHGLKVVMVCGTVHLQGRVVGIFEQQFGLVRDPDSDNNLKVKFVKLKLQRQDSNMLPTLEQTGRILPIDA